MEGRNGTDMKNKIIPLIVTICVSVFVLSGCNKSLNYIIDNKPSITGIVRKVNNGSVIMYSETMVGYPYGAEIIIPLDVEYKDSYTDVAIGNEIVVYYNGDIIETAPLQLGEVYAILLKTPAD